MPKIKDISGQTYGPLKVISFDKLINNRSKWFCKCICGNVRSIDKSNIKRAANKQILCYCTRKDTKCDFPAAKTKEYHAWLHMKRRCYNIKDPRFHTYGGRGISVCDRWLNSFRLFLEDVGFAPSPCHSIDRIHNDKDYEPNNCKWSTRVEQANNTTRNKKYTHLGKSQTLSQWGRDIGIKPGTLLARIRNGWSIEETFSYKTSYRRPHLWLRTIGHLVI